MQISLNQIMEMPNAAILAERLKSALEEEQKKRRHFYEITEENKKMEFINGEIIFQSPAKLRHTTALSLLLGLLKFYVAKKDLGYVGGEKMLISLTRNDYEPDICFFGKEKAQDFTENQMQFPAPDFVVEVLSPSTEKIDRDTKFQDYAAHGVSEYWIIEPEKKFVEQYFLENEEYELFAKINDGEIQSNIVQGFRIPVKAIFDEQIGCEVMVNLLS
jgi:Uma2 family endonuclease